MVLRRRVFRVANLENGPILRKSGGMYPTNNPANPPNQDRSFAGTNSISRWRLYNYSLHILSVVVLIICIVFGQTRLHVHNECDMTWSRRHFVELTALADQKAHNKPTAYRVFKFMDHRDPRHRELLQKESVADDSWCLSKQAQTVPLIVYVPGHFGSYEQSRSLGAHGTQLTARNTQQQHDQAVLQKLSNLRNNHTATAIESMDDFFFDVVAIDFREEGGGFHGAIIQRQAEFIANTVSQITQTCRNVKSIAIVAHSIGGISTRWALYKFPAEMAVIRNVVTLGTPHAHTVLSWQSTLRNMYREIGTLSLNSKNIDGDDNNNNVALVSIAGGLRDEMIPPMACEIENGLSLLATDIMQNGTVEARNVPVALGMDHRALVWCHNLLTPVRNILFGLLLKASNKSVESRLARANEVSFRPHTRRVDYSEDYQVAVRGIRKTLQDSYGYWMALALETSLLYHLEIVVHAALCIGAFRCLYPDFASVRGMSSESYISGRFLWLPPIVFSVLRYCYTLLLSRSHLERDTLIAPRYPTILVLALVADSVFLALGWIMRRFRRGRIYFIQTKRVPNGVMKIGWWISILLLICTALGNHVFIQLPWKGFFCAMALLLSYFMGLAVIAFEGDDCVGASADQPINFVVWVMIWLFVFEFGDVVAIYKGLTPTWEIPMLALLFCGQFWILLTKRLRACDPVHADSSSEIWAKHHTTAWATIGTLGCWVLFAYY
jgi:PGAP1-like protein